MKITKSFKAFFFLIFFFSGNHIIGQDCSFAWIDLESQSKVDSFPILFPGCDTLQGWLRIGQGIDSDITNLDSLSQIKVLLGDLQIIGNNLLENTKGLNNIRVITGAINISQNEIIQEIGFLDSLSKFSSLIIESNSSLQLIPSFHLLKHVRHTIIINNNAQLNGKLYFPILDTVKYNFIITGNNLLDSIQADSLKYCKDLGIGDNQNLKSISGFNLLRQVRYLGLSSNLSLDIVDAFHNLEEASDIVLLDLSFIQNEFLGSLIKIQRNLTIIRTNFKDLNFLNSLTSFQKLRLKENDFLQSINFNHEIQIDNIDSILIIDCPILELCATSVICNFLLEDPGRLVVSGNKEGCNSVEEIKPSCTTNVSIPGKNEQIRIFPNPAKSELNIEGDGIKHIIIYNIQGDEVLNITTTDNKINIDALTNGLYIISINSGFQRFTKID